MSFTCLIQLHSIGVRNTFRVSNLDPQKNLRATRVCLPTIQDALTDEFPEGSGSRGARKMEYFQSKILFSPAIVNEFPPARHAALKRLADRDALVSRRHVFELARGP